ncbi:fructosamine kinase family protein [Lutibaculum baratangense]|uniref:Ribulosamine/erythrulosamine 3-kinase potentially involved in protein deglycation n=1 Tax=Lutibaculum baratangense AMV1 TaxID=631454 RepID=V4RGM9_9HYPH|nr:fructosamine kinase family protein [Lutibaculum baratangense]ESR22415.1 Ribulosamine/erythrulosamine 3-kinase potentially involved in protein deglycation [Lutibaculum baratangense AMV1]
MTDLAAAGAALLGGSVRLSHPLGGGDLSELVLITLDDCREAVVKGGPAPRTEAAMLQAIAAAGAPAPAVLAVSDEVLVLERLRENGTLGRAGASLGGALRTLHATVGRRYGWDRDYAFGRVAIENGESDDWPVFWAERRLLAHVDHLPPDLTRRVNRLAATLPDRLPHSPPASLLHGDLWSGNVVASGDAVTGLIDPACYHGHAEVDLAMLTLFGNPGRAFFEAYGPLEPGHGERRPIYQLWPALVHFRLFGAGYRRMAEGLLEAAGA